MLVRRKIYLIYIVALLAGAVGFKDATASIKDLEPLLGFDAYSLLLGGVYLILSMSIMEYFVFYRLRRMNKELIRMKEEKYCSNKRLFDDSSSDEINSIIKSINSVIELAQKSASEGKIIDKLYQSLVHDSPVLVYRFNKDGMITYVSDSYLEAYGTTKEEIIGENIYNHIGRLGGDASSIRSKVAVLGPNRRGTSFSYDTPLVVNQDIPKWPAWSVCAIMEDNENIVEYQAVGINMYVHDSSIAGGRNDHRINEAVPNIFDSVHESDREKIINGFDDAKSSDATVHMNCRVMNKEGIYVPMQLSVSKDVDNQIVIHAIDITEIESAQKEVVGAVKNMNRAIVISSLGSKPITN